MGRKRRPSGQQPFHFLQRTQVLSPAPCTGGPPPPVTPALDSLYLLASIGHLGSCGHTHRQKHTHTHNHINLIFKAIKQTPFSFICFSFYPILSALRFDDSPCTSHLPFGDVMRLWLSETHLHNVICRNQLDCQRHPWNGPSISALRHQMGTDNTVAAGYGLPGTDSQDKAFYILSRKLGLTVDKHRADSMTGE